LESSRAISLWPSRNSLKPETSPPGEGSRSLCIAESWALIKALLLVQNAFGFSLTHRATPDARPGIAERRMVLFKLLSFTSADYYAVASAISGMDVQKRDMLASSRASRPDTSWSRPVKGLLLFMKAWGFLGTPRHSRMFAGANCCNAGDSLFKTDCRFTARDLTQLPRDLGVGCP